MTKSPVLDKYSRPFDKSKKDNVEEKVNLQEEIDVEEKEEPREEDRRQKEKPTESGRSPQGIDLSIFAVKGVYAFLKKNPRLEPYSSYFDIGHLDKSKFNKKAEYLFTIVQQKKLSGKKAMKYIEKGLVNYIISGEAFREDSKKLLKLRKNLEGIVWLPWSKGKKILEAESALKYGDSISSAYKNLRESLALAGAEDEDLQDLEKSVRRLQGAYILNKQADYIGASGIISDKKYMNYKESVGKAFSKSRGEIESIMDKYASKISSSIIGIFGFGLIVASGMKFTGNVIGNTSLYPNVGIGFGLGSILIIASFLLFAKASRRSKIRRIHEIKMR